MKDQNDQKTPDLMSGAVRPGRPRKPNAKTPAERMREYRARLAAGAVTGKPATLFEVLPPLLQVYILGVQKMLAEGEDQHFTVDEILEIALESAFRSQAQKGGWELPSLPVPRNALDGH